MAGKKKERVRWEEETGEYVDCAVARGFPLGGIGSGGFSIGSDGMFTEFRMNNNWMNPVRNVPGTFFAVYAEKQGEKETRILRRSAPQKEYENIRPVRSTRFKGELPGFLLTFDDDIPLSVRLSGFTPHVPHNLEDSTLPAAWFTLELVNTAELEVSASALFSWQNILGCGGTGHTGLKKRGKLPYGLKGKLTYRDFKGNYQEMSEAGDAALLFRTRQEPHPRSHRMSTIGEYCLRAVVPAGFEAFVCEVWDAAESSPSLFQEFSASGTVAERYGSGQEPSFPAGAVAVRGVLAPGEKKEVSFIISWWLPDHVTEKEPVKKKKSGKHDGVHAGHLYERFHQGAESVASYLVSEKERLFEESFELSGLVDTSSLPAWLKRAVKNSIDSTLCNTVVSGEGAMYTLEGMDWGWPYGGLTGTNDQRLSAHPYTSVFFSGLDKSEIEAFRKLLDERGACPHGNGNCDTALGDADVPYGWPDEIIFVLPAKEWTDLTMSEIIQAAKLYRITADKEWLSRFWPDLKRMAGYLEGISKHGVPEGGTTYDVWDFPGSFIYSATVYLAALSALIDLASEVEPEAADEFRQRYERCQARINEALWMEKEGYFRSTPEKNTIFTAALAGDWAARYSGLPSVVEPQRARRHLELAYRVLIEGARQKAGEKGKFARPWSEAFPDGREKRNVLGYFYGNIHMVYIWQVLSYQAMEHVYLGQVDKGLEVMKMVYERIYKKGHAWGAGLMGDADSVYMTHPVIWAAFNAFAGAALDAPRKTLTLGPRPLPDEDRTVMPFFFPGFWALLEHEKQSGKTRLEVKKHFGEPLVIEKIRHNPLEGETETIELENPVVLKAGAEWSGVLKSG
ncbi:MAG: GH116 family glycosyl-hydrolase [bacterium]